MMNYIVTKDEKYFINENYPFCKISDIILPKKISFDTETTGLISRKHDIFCVQIGTGKNNYLIKLYDNDYTIQEVIELIKNNTLVIHNSLFDLGFLYKYNYFPTDIRDTMLASKIIYNGDFLNAQHDFKSCMKRELDIIYDKTEQKNISTVKLSQSSTISYSFNDVDRLLELHDKLENKIIANNQVNTYDLHCKFIRALAYVERCGLPISEVKWKNKIKEDMYLSDKYEKDIIKYIHKNIPEFRQNQLDIFESKETVKILLTSPLQMLKVFNKLNINTKDKDGKDSINEAVISKTKHEFVDLWLKFQESKHRVTTFGENILSHMENDRLYTNFNPAVDTARLSTRKGYINFLNFPADLSTRECFETKEGNTMIVCDWSGQETVIAADLSNDEAMVDSVVHGKDLHCAFARVLYPEIEELEDEVIMKNHKDKRNAAKVPRFAFQYGGSAYTIHESQGIPLDEAYIIEKAFKELHEGFYNWGELEYQKAIKTGYVVSADGWRLKLSKYDYFKSLLLNVSDIDKSEWMLYREGKMEFSAELDAKEKKLPYKVVNRQAYNYYKLKKKDVSNFYKMKSEYQRLCLNNPVQTTGAHQLKLATYLLFTWILENNYIGIVYICNLVHDEIVAECPDYLAETVRLKIQEVMIEAGNHYLITMKIKASAHTGKSWGEAK